MTEKKILTLTEVAAYLGINKRKLYRMIEDGRFGIQSIPRLNPRMWNKEDIDSWIAGE